MIEIEKLKRIQLLLFYTSGCPVLFFFFYHRDGKRLTMCSFAISFIFVNETYFIRGKIVIIMCAVCTSRMKCSERWKIVHRTHTHTLGGIEWPVKLETNVDNDKIGHTNHRHSRNYIENYVNVVFQIQKTRAREEGTAYGPMIVRSTGRSLSKDLGTWEIKVIYFRCVFLLCLVASLLFPNNNNKKHNN